MLGDTLLHVRCTVDAHMLMLQQMMLRRDVRFNAEYAFRGECAGRCGRQTGVEWVVVVFEFVMILYATLLAMRMTNVAHSCWGNCD